MPIDSEQGHEVVERSGTRCAALDDRYETNTHSKVREANKKSTGLAKAAAVDAKEIFLGIDAADARQVVTRFIPGQGTKPAERMTRETLVKRVAQLRKAGVSVQGVYEADRPGLRLRVS